MQTVPHNTYVIPVDFANRQDNIVTRDEHLQDNRSARRRQLLRIHYQVDPTNV